MTCPSSWPQNIAHRRWRLLALATALATPPATVPAPAVAEAVATCGEGLRGERHGVVAVVDAETLRLDDGSEVRLIGAMAPRAADHDVALASADHWPPEAAAREALASSTLGRSIELVAFGPARDRYGRRLAQAFIAPAVGGARVWVQGALVEAGHARAYGIPGSYGCIDALLAAERRARSARAGLWSLAVYSPRSAHRTRVLTVLRETYQLVEGRVTRARRTRKGIFVDFGRDWRWDFSMVILPAAEKENPAWASGLLDLTGKRLRARGWIVRRNGPAIEIDHPSQIEILD